MPKYEYVCKCGYTTEVSRPVVKRDDPVYCPKCDFEPTMERLPAAPNFVVEGWNAKNGYSDD